MSSDTTPNRRPKRVGDLLRHEIAQILQRDVKDPRVGFVTITDVEVSADLRVAKVYYSVLGEAAQRVETRKGLQSATAFLRHEVGQRLRLKTTPELRFCYDTALEQGMHMDQVLEGIRHDSEKPDR